MAAKMQCRFCHIVFICICGVVSLGTSEAFNFREKSPSEDFTDHEVIKHRILHGRSKREMSNSLEEKRDHPRELEVTLVLDGIQSVLDLVLNDDLTVASYFEKIQRNGSYHVHRPPVDDMKSCHYHGVIRNVPKSWAAVSTCKGLKGVVFDGSNMFYIDEGPRDGLSYVYDGRHLRNDQNRTCGFSKTNHILRIKRETEIIHGPYRANGQSKYVELLLVVDNKEFKDLGSLEAVHRRCKDITNIMNALYTPLNIFISLIGVVVWTEKDEIEISRNGDKSLTNFLRYRKEVLNRDHPNDNAMLITKTVFDGGVIGKALRGPICTFEFSGAIGLDFSEVVGVIANNLAHQLGHNLGMEHDTSGCECPVDRCIMSSTSSATLVPAHWSSCSLKSLAKAFEQGMDHCLRNKPEKLFGSTVCGNGFVEPGEQCDCGLDYRCDNPCCNATSCMLFSNASCATGHCCDLQTCKLKNSGTMCRPVEHECDLPEFCTGESEHCPDDVFKRNGEPCKHGQAFCYQGICNTHTDQCRLLWGPTGNNSLSVCYNQNTKGLRQGNCGFDLPQQKYMNCSKENVYCGRLHCTHSSDRLKYGLEAVSSLTSSYFNVRGKIVSCKTVMIDLGLNDPDPGLVPDGAKCDDEKMCVNKECIPVETVRRMSSGSCPNNCSDNGVCNSRGNCHCSYGFAPPLCDQPGTGGSMDSGPVPLKTEYN